MACRTLEDWWYDYRRGGFAALHPKQRADRGVPRVLSSEQEEKILASVRANLGRPVKVLYRLWKEEDPRLPGLGVIYRTLREHGLDAKTRSGLLRQGLSGPAKAFEAPLVNDLWMVDFSPGPFLPPSSGRGRMSPTHLCAIIDDHSRLIVHAQYHTAADTRAFHHTLREAILRRGVPSKLYTDQGGPFINDHTRLICANLGLRLLHAKPYHAWSKGKIERFFRSLQQDFESGLRQPDRKPRDLAELNAGLAQWLQGVYHIRHHEGIGMSPGQRFAQGAPFVRPLDPDLDLPRLFYNRVERLVRKDGTVRHNNRLYEVDLALRGRKVRLAFDPWTLERVEVQYRGQDFGVATLADLHRNSQIDGSQHYDRPEER